MKFVILLAVMVSLAVARPDEHYVTKFDDMELSEILDNDRLLEAYTRCFLGEQKCTPEGNDLKKILPEAIQTSCAKCTDKQKVMAAKTMKAVMKKLPAEWEKLKKQSDPNGERQEELDKFIEEYSK